MCKGFDPNYKLPKWDENISCFIVNRELTDTFQPTCDICKKKVNGTNYYQSTDSDYVFHRKCYKPKSENLRTLTTEESSNTLKFERIKKMSTKFVTKKQQEKRQLKSSGYYWRGYLNYALDEDPNVKVLKLKFIFLQFFLYCRCTLITGN